jgi:hypothetical protein
LKCILTCGAKFRVSGFEFRAAPRLDQSRNLRTRNS